VATDPKVVVLVGSLRKESFSRKLAKGLTSLHAAPLEFEIAEIGHLPLYNEDLEPAPPAPWLALRQQVRRSDAVLFVTPEYNRSIPGCLKNAIDVASRPYGQSALEAMPGAVISLSPGGLGGFGANQHLRQCLVFLNVPAMPQPEAYLGGAKSLFDSEGHLTHSSTRDFLAKFTQAFAKWIDANGRQ
jgi:chromate reductase